MSVVSDRIKGFLDKVDIIYVATSDENGIPHIAVAEDIQIIDGGKTDCIHIMVLHKVT